MIRLSRTIKKIVISVLGNKNAILILAYFH